MSQYVVEDWRATLALRDALAQGHWPPPRPECAVSPDEPGFAVLPTRIDQLSGVQLAYAASDASTHAAAQHWAPLVEGQAWLTQHRVLVRGVSELSLGWAGLRSLGPDLEGVVFAYDSGVYLLRTHAPVWLDTMIRAVAYGQVGSAAPPDWVARQLGRS